MANDIASLMRLIGSGPNVARRIAEVEAELSRYGFDLKDPEVREKALAEIRRRNAEDEASPVPTTLAALVQESAEARAFRQAAAGKNVVYYVDLYGAAIKIGTSSNMALRLVGLRRKVEHLLAVEPGSYGVERQRHTEFRADRIDTSEDFQRSPALLAHIASVRERCGDPVQLLLAVGQEACA